VSSSSISAKDDNSTNKRILNKLETIYMRFRKTEVDGVTVIEFRVNNEGGDGTSCFEIKLQTNTTKLTNNMKAEIWSEKVSN